MKKRWFKDNRGMSTVFAIIVSTVILVFCLALLLVSYTLYTSSLKLQNRSKCRALTVSLTQELEKSIAEVSFDGWEAEDEAREKGEYRLWFYIRDNLDAINWQNYEAGNPDAGHELSDRVFETSGNATVTMYWTYGEDDEEYDEDYDDFSDADIYLYVRVESSVGSENYSLTSCYSLEADEMYDESDEYKWVWHYEGRGESDEG
jgi:hypothetical protein